MTKSGAATIIRNSIVWDMTIPWCLTKDDQETFPRFHDAGFTLISATIADDHDTVQSALANISFLRTRLAAEPERYVIVKGVEDIVQAKRRGLLAVTFHTQGTAWINDLSVLDAFYELGLRHILLAYQVRNRVADGCAERTDAGLSKFGLRLIEKMNSLGLLVDCSHTGSRSSLDAIEASTTPAIFSHSNSRSVYGHYRNITDEQALACAKKGGVIGVVGLEAFIGKGDATAAGMFKHIDHYLNLIGPDAVGLGLDFVADAVGLGKRLGSPGVHGTDAWPDFDGMKGIRTQTFIQPEQLSELIEEMLRHNYPEDTIRRILGENFLRVSRQVWESRRTREATIPC